MKLLLLTEGDAERYDSWSGTAKSVVDHLRLAGHAVTTADADLYGVQRMLAAGLSFAPNRKRWGVKYHLGDVGYAFRTRKATAIIDAYRNSTDCILQIGATFEPRGRGAIPYTMFCDSNIVTSLEGAKYGVSDTAWLSQGEFESIRRRETPIYNDAACIMTISEWLRHSFIEHFGVPADRVVTVGAGPNLDLGKVPEPRSAPRDGPPTILFVGKQFERKGGAYLLEAFRMVRQQLKDARLIIVGPVTSPSSDPGIEWIGNLNKNTAEGWARMAAAYRDADLFCLPSLFEPFGIVILEAMFFGLPCVGTAEWAIPEMIVDGETGYTVPRANADALAQRFLELLRDRDLGHRMGLAGRKRAQERFSWPSVAGRMTEAMRRAVPGSR